MIPFRAATLRLPTAVYGQGPTQQVGLFRGHPRCRGLYADWNFALQNLNQVSQLPTLWDTTGKWPMTGVGGITELGVTWGRSPWGRCVIVDGNSRVALSTPPYPGVFPVPFTVQSVISSPSASAQAGIRAANSMGSGAGTYDTVTMVWDHTTAFAARCWQFYNTPSGTFVRLQYPQAFNANTWYDLTCTVDAAGNCTIYMNGVRAAGPTALGQIPDAGREGTNGITIGVQLSSGHTGLINFWQGSTAFLRYWTRALRPEEVRDLNVHPFSHYMLG
jgi:hypothetical protein